jgi:hypothetical protein
LSNQNSSNPDQIITLQVGSPDDLPVTGAWDGKRTKVGIAG